MSNTEEEKSAATDILNHIDEHFDLDFLVCRGQYAILVRGDTGMINITTGPCLRGGVISVIDMVNDHFDDNSRQVQFKKVTCPCTWKCPMYQEEGPITLNKDNVTTTIWLAFASIFQMPNNMNVEEFLSFIGYGSDFMIEVFKKVYQPVHFCCHERTEKQIVIHPNSNNTGMTHFSAHRQRNSDFVENYAVFANWWFDTSEHSTVHRVLLTRFRNDDIEPQELLDFVHSNM